MERSKSSDLSLFSYEILGLVGREGAGPHDLRRMVQRGRVLDWAGESQYYAEPKRLARLGYLETHKERGRTRERTVYTLTEKGLEALREWGRAPARFTPLKSEPLVHVLITDLVGEATTRESLTALRAEIGELRALLNEAESSAETLPHRERYLKLTLRFLRRYLELHSELIDEVESEFD